MADGRRQMAPPARGFFCHPPSAICHPLMKIGITCYPTFGGSGVVATELGMALASRGDDVHFISYAMPSRLNTVHERIRFHEVTVTNYPLFDPYPPYMLALATKMAEVADYEKIEVIPNFVDPARFRRHESPYVHLLGDGGEKLVCHVSNFRPVKRIMDVLAVFERVSRMVPSRLAMIGDGPDRSRAEAFCREHH